MPNDSRSKHATPPRWVVMGVSGCGKSEVGRRLAERLGLLHVEGDADHPPANIAKMAAGTPLGDSDRQGWLDLLRQRISDAAAKGTGLVLSCSALKRRYRDLLRAGDPDLFFLHLNGDRDLIAGRMQTRANHFMPVALLDSQFRDLEPLQEDENGVTVDIRFPPQALVEQAIRHIESGRSGLPDHGMEEK
jgi:gluconokinase